MDIYFKKVIGIDHWYNLDEKHKDYLDTSSGSPQLVKKLVSKPYWMQLTINIMYHIFIGFFITFPVIFSIYFTVIRNDERIFLANLYNIMDVGLFITNIIYFYDNHYKEYLLKTDFNKWVIIINKIECISSVIYVIINIILLFTGYQINIYSDLWNDINAVTQVFLTICLIIEKFISFAIYQSTINIFLFSLFSHIHKINKFIKSYNEEASEDSYDTRMLVKELIKLRNSYGKTVSSLSYTFTVLSFAGIIAGYFLVRIDIDGNFYNGISQYINGVIFLILELIYFLAIYLMNQKLFELQSIHYSNDVIDNYLPNGKLEFFKGLKSKSIRLLTRTHSEENLKHNGATAPHSDILVTTSQIVARQTFLYEWEFLKNEINEPWSKFTFLGFEINNKSIFIKAFGLIFVLIFGFELALG